MQCIQIVLTIVFNFGLKPKWLKNEFIFSLDDNMANVYIYNIAMAARFS